MCKFIFLILLTSCAAKPIFKRTTRDGGRVLILGGKSTNNSNIIMDRDKLIKTKCKNGFEIIAEGFEEQAGYNGMGVLSKYYDFKCKG